MRDPSAGGTMRRSGFVVPAMVATLALVLVPARPAAACGGCFHPPVQVPSDITDERMLLSVSPTQTTLYDQIRYAGTPSSFAWVLPIHGTVTVGLSADVLFASIDALTVTQIQPPPSQCPPAPTCNSGGCGSIGHSAALSASAANAGADAQVTVTKQANVGPYATVQLHATDSSALNDWLAQNGFVIPPDVTPVLDEYVREGFDFLAMKLLPNEGVQAMRPVRVSSPGASFSLPLRMAAIGTGVSVGITIWVVSDSRYEPQNFPFFHIDDSALVWDWKTSLSNYTTLRVENEAPSGNKNWEIESSIDLARQVITSVILSGGHYLPGRGGFGSSQAPADPTEDYLPVGPGPGAASPEGGPSDAGGGTNADAESTDGAGLTQTAEEVRTADIDALFAGMPGPNARVTRIRSDIAHAAMTADLVLQASADQSELSNVRVVTHSVNEQCPIYNGCDVVGSGSPAQSEASEHHGCATSTRAIVDPSAGSGALAGMGALLVARVLRSRRRSARRK
jgi:Uncharacterized protein conserved in bacteria (DUF2330)